MQSTICSCLVKRHMCQLYQIPAPQRNALIPIAMSTLLFGTMKLFLIVFSSNDWCLAWHEKIGTPTSRSARFDAMTDLRRVGDRRSNRYAATMFTSFFGTTMTF